MLKKLLERNFRSKIDFEYREYQLDYNLKRFEYLSKIGIFICLLIFLNGVFKTSFYDISLGLLGIFLNFMFNRKFKEILKDGGSNNRPSWVSNFVYFYILIMGFYQLALLYCDFNGSGDYLSVIVLVNLLVMIPDLDFYIISLYLSLFLIISAIIIITSNYFVYYSKSIFDVTIFYLIGFFVAFFNSNRSYELFKRGEELKKANELLGKLVVTDNLTSLHNRRAFEEKFDSLWLNCKRAERAFSILMIDVDNFKAYNDKLGHPAGDKALIALSRIMQNSLRRATDFLARYGGEEFVILLPYTNHDYALELAEQIRKDIENSKIIHPEGQVSNYVTVSIGVSSVIPNDSLTRNSLLITADEALYIAKANGKNKVHYRHISKHLFSRDNSKN